MPARHQCGIGRIVEFEIAGDRIDRSTELRDSLGITRRLREHQREPAGGRLDQRALTQASPERARRQPGIDQRHRHGFALSRSHQVGPQLGLHQQANGRAPGSQKAAGGAGIVIGQIGLNEAITEFFGEQIRCGIATGRRHAGHQDAGVRVARSERAHQRLRGTRLADRDRVNPDQGARVWLSPVQKAEALGPVRKVSRLAQRSPQQIGHDQRRCEQPAEGIERQHQGEGWEGGAARG